MVIVQVGANDGKTHDPLHNFAMQYRERTEMVLIEPQTEVLRDLQINYSEHPATTVLNSAVGEPGNLTLYRIKPQYWRFYRGILGSGITSSDRDYVLEKARRHLALRSISPEEAIEDIHPASETLRSLLSAAGIESVDVLQVDVEGADDLVIYSADLDLLRPRVVNYEAVHLSPSRLCELDTHLQAHSYVSTGWTDQDRCAIRVQ